MFIGTDGFKGLFIAVGILGIIIVLTLMIIDGCISNKPVKKALRFLAALVLLFSVYVLVMS